MRYSISFSNFQNISEPIIVTYLLVSTVSSSQDKVVCDERPSTEPHVVYEQRHYPRPLVLLGLEPADDPLVPRVVSVVLDAADVVEVPAGPQVGLRLVEVPLVRERSGPPAQCVLLQPRSEPDQHQDREDTRHGPGLLGEVSASGWSPVLLRSEVGQTQTQARQHQHQNRLHLATGQ